MKVLIVDDHDVIRQSLALTIKTEFPLADCVKAENAGTCIEILKQEQFDLVTLDLNLPDMDGLTLADWILERDPTQMILVFSMNPTNVFAKKLYEMGVMGYLNKQAAMSELTRALRMILTERRPYMDEEFKSILASDFLQKKPANPLEMLSTRELSIAQLLASGKTNDQIAAQLNIEPSTIRTHKTRIFQKLDVTTLHEFLAKAKMYKLI
ncbi:MAG TPA: response regulator transcription factor [Chitinophagaceae bacterium]